MFKNKRLLILADSSGREIMRCPVSLGSDPTGTKTCEGDGRTPEGEYYICSINRASKYHISLGISYPNPSDARRAYSEKRIGLSTFWLLRLCGMMRLRPLWNTSLGGYVMIHGEDPCGRTGDWTAGCIAISNRDIEQLASLCRKGERIRII